MNKIENLEQLLDVSEVVDTFADAAKELNLNFDYMGPSSMGDLMHIDIWSDSSRINLSFTYPLYLRNKELNCLTIEEAKEIIQEEIMNY